MNQKTREASNAREIEEMLIYVSLFESLDHPELNKLQFRHTFPMYPSQLDRIVGANDLISARGKVIDQSLDKILGKIPMLSSNLLGNSDRADCKLSLHACRELWGHEKARRTAIINASLPHGCRPINENCRLIDAFAFDINPDGLVVNASSFTWNYVRGRLFITSAKLEDDQELNLEHTGLMTWAVFNHKARKQCWMVDIGYDGRHNASISMITDATGVKEFFRLRDVPPGGARRDALAHWVSSHWRQYRHDPEMEGYVREFLRGKTDFKWFNMGVSINIPESDQAKIEQIKRNRLVMKVLGTDKRRRLP